MALGLPLPQLRKLECKMWQRCRARSLSSLEECRRDTAGKKGVKGLLLVARQEKVLCRFGLRTGDPSNTADGAGNRGRPPSRAWITGKNWGLPEPRNSFPEICMGIRLYSAQNGICINICPKILNEEQIQKIPDQTYSQDGDVCRHTVPPCTTKRRTTTHLKTKNNQNFLQIKLY